MRAHQSVLVIDDLIIIVLATVLLACGWVVGGAPIGEQCSDDIQKVTSCLSFATGGAATPSKECCNAVRDIKDRDPVCLCYVIQQTHNGSEQAKNLGIQESRLLQLPSACKLANASISECPKLLKIPANSPDYAIFSNSSASTTAPPKTTTTGTQSAAATAGSNGFKHPPNFSEAMAIAMAIFFFHAFPVGFVSVFYTRT